MNRNVSDRDILRQKHRVVKGVGCLTYYASERNSINYDYIII
jgi:hypothetical protein